MAIAIKDFTTIKTEMQSDLSTLLPQATQGSSSALVSLFVNPPAAQLSFLYQNLLSVSQATQFETLTGADLTKFATNYGLTRKAGVAATGFIYLVLDNSFDSGRDITIPDRSYLSTIGSTPVAFTTQGERVLRAADKNVYASTALQVAPQLAIGGIVDAKYVVAIPITATVSGTDGIVGSYTITQGSLANVSSIVNLQPTQGGYDEESDAELQERLTLVISGNSVGTTDGIKRTALSTPGVNAVFLVLPGDPLMTRDGTVYDESGNLIKAGRGNAIDAYISGQTPTSVIEDYIYKDAGGSENIDINNSIILGKTGTTFLDYHQPVMNVSSVTGSVSGSNFVLATETTDDQGNVVLIGNLAFINDYNASQYTLVENVKTKDLALATFLSPDQTRYAVVAPLTVSASANSLNGEDRLLFLSNQATVTNEQVTRGGEVNGSDQLRYAGVTEVSNLYQDVNVERELVTVSQEGSFTITTRHSPIIAVSQIRHVRLGTLFGSSIVDPTKGLIRITSRFTPQIGDMLEVSYTWRKNYVSGFEYHLLGDSVQWLDSLKDQDSATLNLFTGNAGAGLTLSIQPSTPALLSLTLSNAIPRVVYNAYVEGSIADIYQQTVGFYQPSIAKSPVGDWVFGTQPTVRAEASASFIGQLTKVTNSTKGYNYNLLGASLSTNKHAPNADVNQNLADNQFTLSRAANTTIAEVGDIIHFGTPRSFGYWSSETDFAQNIQGNPAPVYDNTLLKIDPSGEIQLLQKEMNINLPQTLVSGHITQDTTWSGKIFVSGDVIVQAGVVLSIAPGTIISVLTASDLPTVLEKRQSVKLFRSANVAIPTTTSLPSTWEDWTVQYLMFLNSDFGAPFFRLTDTIRINFNNDVISKIRLRNPDTLSYTEQYYYALNGTPISGNEQVDPGGEVQTALDLALATAQLTGILHTIADSITGLPVDTYEVVDVSRLGARVYIVPLENTPRSLSPGVYDISIQDKSNPNNLGSVSYEPTAGPFAVVSYNISDLTQWWLEYGVTTINRLVIRVDGQMLAVSSSQADPIIFTSSAPQAAPGDWGGIRFTSTSHSLNKLNRTGTPSVLQNCIIKYADIPITIANSDPTIDNVIIKHYLSTGGFSQSEPSVLEMYPSSGYVLSNTIFVGTSIARNRITSHEGIPSWISTVVTNYAGTQIESFSGLVSTLGYGYALPSKPLTSTKEVPLMTIVPGNRAVMDLAYGFAPSADKWAVYIDNDLGAFVDITTLPLSPETIMTLVPGVDFGIELNLVSQQAELVFYNTADMTLFLATYAQSQKRYLKISYSCALQNGSVTNCLFAFGANPGWTTSIGTDLSFNGNTFYRAGSSAIKVDTGYVSFTNNIVSEYSTIALQKSLRSFIWSNHNDMHSNQVQAAEPYRPISTDVLLKTFLSTDTILPISNPGKYDIGTVIKVDSEYLKVVQVSSIAVVVERGYFNTQSVQHEEQASLLLLREKTFFAVTGIPANNCSLVITDSSGVQLATTQPVTMVQVAEGSYKIATPVDRRSSVFYRYRFIRTGDSASSYSNVYEMALEQFGNGITDVFIDYQDSSIIQSSNFSADPKFIEPNGENFELASDSPCNVNNPLFATPWDASIAVNRYIGASPRIETMVLAEQTKVIQLAYSIIASGTLTDSIIIQNTTTSVRLMPLSFDPLTNQVTLLYPVRLSDAGEYKIYYNSPVSIGSPILGNPLLGQISYIFDAKRPVQFVKFKATTVGKGGTISFAYRTAATKDELVNATFSSYYVLSGVAEIDLLAVSDANKPPLGAVAEIIIKLSGNDGSFTGAGVYLYPRLQDFTLIYAPEVDSQNYTIKNVTYNNRNDQTALVFEAQNQPGVGVLQTTGATIAGANAVSLWLAKAKTPTTFIELARLVSVHVGDTVVNTLGDVSIIKTAPAVDDVVLVDYSFVAEGLIEQLPFVNSSTQLTTNRFINVTSVNVTGEVDRQLHTLTGETLQIDTTGQPAASGTYNVTYDYVAPVDGETLRVSYVYNSLVGAAQSSIEGNKDVLADILVRGMYTIPITIKMAVVVLPGYAPAAVVSNITQAISLYLEKFTQDNPTGGGRIDAMDTASVVKNVVGVDDLLMIAHYREGYTGVTNIVFSTREIPTLDVTSPEIALSTASSANQLISTSALPK